MSTYTYRYIEVQKERIDGAVWKAENLPDANEHKGETFKINDYQREENSPAYYMSVYIGEETYAWKPVEKVDTYWEPLKWYSYLPKNRVKVNRDPYYKPKYVVAKDADGNEMYIKENLYWCNNGGYIRDDFISNSRWNNSKISGRGLPNDASEEIKKDIESDYHYDVTWVTLSEWEEMFETAKSEFIREVEKRFANKSKDEISEKLDTILAMMKDPDYKPKRKKKKTDDDYCYEDSIEYLFEEDIWKLFHIQTEIDRIEFIVEEFENGYGVLGTRIIYHLA